jgi:hypothetical protein
MIFFPGRWLRRVYRRSVNRLEIWLYGPELVITTLWLRHVAPHIWARLSEGCQIRVHPYLSPATAVGLYAEIHNRVKYDLRLSDPIEHHYTPGAHAFLRSKIVRREIDMASVPFKARGYVKLAATLKWSGNFSAATILYRLLMKAAATKVYGLIGLGDIYLTQANWCRELRFYRETGTWLDPVATFGSDPADALIPRSEDTTYRRAARCFLMSARRLSSCGSDMTNLERALAEGGLELPGPLQRIKRDEIDTKDRITKFRASLLSTLLKHDAGDKRDLAPIQNAFRQIASRRKPWFKRVDDEQWRIGKERFCDNVFVNAEVSTLADICKKLGTEFQITHPGEKLQYTYRCVFRGKVVERTINRALPATGLALLPNVTDLGFGFFLIDDHYVAKDTKHVPWEQARIFCPWLWITDERSAIIELARDSVPIPAGANVSVPIVGHENYYHWLIESAGNCAVLEAASMRVPATLMTYNKLAEFQSEILASVLPGDLPTAVLPRFPRQYRLRKAVVANHLARDQFAHPKATAFLRRKFNVGDELRGQPSKLYLTRFTATRASLANEREVRELVEKYGFTLVDTAKLTVAEQKELFAGCEMVVAPGGAALSNLIFCPVTTKMLILGPETGTFETFTSLAATVGCKSWLCVGRTVEIIPNAMFLWTQHRFDIDLGDLKTCLEEMHAQ